MKKIITTTLFSAALCLGSFAQSIDYDWAFSTGGGFRDVSIANTTDAAGNIYSTGMFDENGAVDFDPSAGVSELTSNGSGDGFVSKYSPSGDLIWAINVGGGGWDVGYSIKVDLNQNVYVAGTFAGVVAFDPSAPTSYSISNGGGDAFILKLNSSGDYQWVKTWGGSGADVAISMDLDDNGNIYATGYFENTVDFDPESSVSELTSNGDLDIYMTKFDSNGNFQWANGFGSTGQDVGRSLVLDADNNVIFGGNYEETVDFNPGGGTNNYNAVTGIDAFVGKYNSDGDFIWVKTYGGAESDYCYNLSVDPSGNIITSGWYGATVDFDPGLGTNELTSNGLEDIYISKFDSDGNHLWVKSFGGTGAERSYSIVADEQYIYSSGSFETTVDFDPSASTTEITSNGDTDIYISVLNANGDFIQAQGIGGIGPDRGRAITLDNSGSVFVSGQFENSADFDASASTNSLTANGDYDAFILKLTNNLPVSVSSITVQGEAGASTISTIAGTLQMEAAVLPANADDASYTWSVANGTGSASIDASGLLTAITDGNVTATATANDGSGITGSAVITISNQNVGLNEEILNGDFSFYPNPVRSEININIDFNIESILITDMTGKVFEKRQAPGKIINVSSLKNGIYLLQIQIENGWLTKKFIKD